MPTSDDYARIIINVGQAMGISERGIAIGIATPLVETGGPKPVGNNMRMYANAKVPQSLNLPHDAVGSDGYSVGLYQQQVRQTNGQWWWADCATCMDAAKSARLFFDRLMNLPYDSPPHSPGYYAQQVQKSAYPDRYDARYSEALDIVRRLSTGKHAMADYGITRIMHGYNVDSVGIGNSNGPRRSTPYFIVHTQEAKSTAISLAQFCNNSTSGGNPVSYNCSIDGRDTVEIVPLNEGPWAAMNANDLGIHACVAGSFAAWSRGQWLDSVDDSGDGLSEDLAITRLAKTLAAAHVQYGVPLDYAGDHGRSGWPVKNAGVVGHMDFGARGGGHHDPGNGFPFDELIKRAHAFLAPVVNLIDACARADQWLGKRKTNGENQLKNGTFAEFENGHVYWKRGTDHAYAVPHGGLFETWGHEYRWEQGPLGYPVREFAKVNGGAVQAFEGGALMRKDGDSRGWWVHGAINVQYAKSGFEQGPLGWPTSDEIAIAGSNIVQHFEHGDLTWSPTGVVVTMKGK